MTTQAQTLRQRLQALAQWEKKCSEHRMVSMGGSGFFCDICKGTGKAPVLPRLRKLCPQCMNIDYPSVAWSLASGPPPRHLCPTCGGDGRVLRGDDTEDGRLLLFGALYQAVLTLVDGCEIGIVGAGNPRFYVEIGSERGDVRIVAEGPTVLEALVDAAMKLKEARP